MRWERRSIEDSNTMPLIFRELWPIQIIDFQCKFAWLKNDRTRQPAIGSHRNENRTMANRMDSSYICYHCLPNVVYRNLKLKQETNNSHSLDWPCIIVLAWQDQYHEINSAGKRTLRFFYRIKNLWEFDDQFHSLYQLQRFRLHRISYGKWETLFNIKFSRTLKSKLLFRLDSW